MMDADHIVALMTSLRDDAKRQVLMRFFKTGEGEYGEGDEFLGIMVPDTRKVVRQVAREVDLSTATALLQSPWHEVRLCGLLIMVDKFKRLCGTKQLNDNDAITWRDDIVRHYVEHAHRANNWDLVDLSAPYILGRWLTVPSGIDDKVGVIDALAHSDNLWRQRISMVCTLMTSRLGDPSWCLRYARVHLRHPHDLMHKAVGWMLREMGKHVNMDLLREFLRKHVHEMSRTTLRYAIERMDTTERRYWLSQ